MLDVHQYEVELADGRNRLDAMELVGLEVIAIKGPHKGRLDPAVIGDGDIIYVPYEDVPTFVISVNLHRRHLTKKEQAALILKAVKPIEDKPARRKEVSPKRAAGVRRTRPS